MDIMHVFQYMNSVFKFIHTSLKSVWIYNIDYAIKNYDKGDKYLTVSKSFSVFFA